MVNVEGGRRRIALARQCGLGALPFGSIPAAPLAIRPQCGLWSAPADEPGETLISTERSELNRTTSRRRSLHHACLAARVADEYRGRDTVVLDLTRITPVVDYFVITTGTSKRQMHAIAEEVDRVLAEENSKRIGLEGYDSSTWILQDYGDVVLHIFTAETRELYALEQLWADAPKIDWNAELTEPAS